MAIYHLQVKIGSKAEGDTAGEKCAYITRTEAYKNKADELAYTASGNMPKWPKPTHKMTQAIIGKQLIFTKETTAGYTVRLNLRYLGN